MRHFSAPRPRTLRWTAAVLAFATVLTVLAWTSGSNPMLLTLAILLALLTVVALGVAQATAHPTSHPDLDDAEAGDTELIHLDRSTVPGETEDDRRLDVDPHQVHDLGGLIDWIGSNNYLTTAAPEGGSWLVRLGQQKAATMIPAGAVPHVLPVSTPLAAGNHVSVQWREARGLPGR